MKADTGEQEERESRLWETLIGQLAYLVDEVDALREVIVRVPDAVLSGRPYEGEISVKEMYGVLALADETVFLPQVERLAGGAEAVVCEVDRVALSTREPWPEYPMETILARVKQAREHLIERIRRLDDAGWEAASRAKRRGYYALLHAIIQHDTDTLRAVGHRFHESRLGAPPDESE